MCSQTATPPEPIDPAEAQPLAAQQAEPASPTTESTDLALPESFTVYLARHATPDRSRPEIIYHSLPGPALNERGLQESAELAAFLQEAGIVGILSSPFERAKQTALAASQQSGARLELDPDLGERQPIETEASVMGRMLHVFLAAAQRAARRGPLAMFTHGSPVLVLLKTLGLPLTTLERCRIYDNRNLIAMAGAWRIERLDGSLSMRPVFVPQGVALPNLPEDELEKESP